jgi:hypothetical protein
MKSKKPRSARRARIYDRRTTQKRDFDLLRAAFEQFATWLSGKTTRSVEEFREVASAIDQMATHWRCNRNGRYDKMPPWRFNERMFPSLLDDGVGIIRGGAGLQLPSTLSKWDVASAHEHVTDPVARLLLAVLWKNGDFQKVQLVLAGVLGQLPQQVLSPLRSAQGAEETNTPNPEDRLEDEPDQLLQTRSVFLQFGRHLASPQTQPIFDQHTSRAKILLERLKQWKDIESFRGLFLGVPSAIPSKAEGLTDSKLCNEYLIWWNKTVKERLPREPEPDRLEAMLLGDRLLFGLGRWARPRGWLVKPTH